MPFARIRRFARSLVPVVAHLAPAIGVSAGVAIVALPAPAFAQVTTADVRGTVVGADDQQAIAEVTVTIVDEARGATKTVTTNSDGGFLFSNLPVGGPYRVTADLVGFKQSEVKDIYLTAGKPRDVRLEMRIQSEVIEVSGTSVPRNTSARTVITSQEIDQLPTVTRDPRDFVRRSPEASVEGSDHTLSIGGANTRFNSITVDGIRQDDDFGLNASGYPTRRSPIAVSAIEQLAVEIAPFDVRYGKFTGGNVNILTKSGTNDYHGELLFTYSGDALTGHQSDHDHFTSHLNEFRYGAAVGGPIVEDKIHFFADVEGLSANSPVSNGPMGSGAANTTSKVTSAEMAMAQQIAQQVYGLDAGVPDKNIHESDLKVFAKGTWAIDNHHRAVVSYQRTAGDNDTPSFSTDSNLALSSNWYDQKDTMNAFSARLYSDWSDKLSTEASFDGKYVSSRPTPLNGNGFMQANIRTPEGGQIILGPDEFRHTNVLDDNILHGKIAANYLLGKNLITAGIEYEYLTIFNDFIQDTNGFATYASLDAFANRTPIQINYSAAVDPSGVGAADPSTGAANFHTGTGTIYLQDQVKLTDELTLTAGVRFELYTSDTNIRENPNFVDRYGFSNTSTLNGRTLFMPRVGLSYLPDEHINLRVGGGLYSGGSPGVWVSNAYTNNGVGISSTTSMDPAIINGFDGRNIPDALKAKIIAGNGNTDALDPNFELPSVWKFGTGADLALDGLADELKSTMVRLNYVFSKTHNGVMWQDLRRDLASLPNNLPVATAPDGRPIYDFANFNANRGLDTLLTNTSRGYGHVASIQLEKSFTWGLLVSGSYAYQHVLEVNPGTSSRAVSNYDTLAVIDPNHPELAESNYERPHHFTLAVEYSHPIVAEFVDGSLWANMKTSIGLFAEARSGQTYSWTFGDSNFGTNLAKTFGEDRSIASHNMELFYVPKGDGSDVNLVGIDPAEFENFLAQTGLDKYRGKIAPRNAFSSPWYKRIDMRLAQDLPNPFTGHRARFVVDIENVGNLLNHGWGRFTTVPFPGVTPAVDVAYDAATGKYNYSNLRVPDPNRVDLLQSVWKISLGLMYDF